MKYLALLGLAYIAVVQGAVLKNDQCDAQNFGVCTDAFAKMLGLSEFPKDPSVIVYTVYKIQATQGLDGQKQICKATIYLKTCLGEQYDACISVQFFQSIGESVKDAQVFVEMAAQQQYICTAGWADYSKNFDCISKISQKEQKALAQCQADYGMSIAKDPKNACKYNQVLSDCYTKPFKTECDQSASLVLCNSMKASFNPIFPQCTITC